MKVISSKGNSRYRYWKDLLEGSELKQSSDFLVMGRKLVPEFLERHPSDISEVLISSPDQLENLFGSTTATICLLEKDLFRQLDIFGTRHPLLVVRQPQIPQADIKLKPEGLEVFTALGDPSNLGALLRCCEAFEISKVILLQESTHPFHPKAVRASAGSAFRVPLSWGPSIHQEMGEILSLDREGRSLATYEWPFSARLLFGEEGPGLPQNKRNDLCLRIPTGAGIESLNAVSAASIALFHYRLQYPLS